MKVLVTGAGGFIGSHLVEALLAAGATVRAFVRYSSQRSPGNLAAVAAREGERLEFCYGDLRDATAVERAVAGCRVVFHLGALISIPYSYQNPEAYLETNLRGTFHVLEACRKSPVDRLIIVSTSEVYGSARYVPIDEDHPLKAQSPYAASKIAAEKLGESYWRSFGLPVVILRPFNTYGPRQSLRAVIPQVLVQLLRGPEVRLGNLTPRRDFLYVHDTVAGFMAAAICPTAVGETINLGTGRDISVAELVELAGEVVGRRPRIVKEEERMRPPTSEVTRLLADARKAARVLGWRPQVDLREGLRLTAAWLAGCHLPEEGYWI
ncbi:MAG: SDR family NAD(P)-dependent oxidoreductase [Firmicutes bacterium]|nr:SDR family NAD(P)-dependent oxidoreductase [Bacillota bacterium]